MANEGSTKPTLNCGHPAELLIKSVESTYQFCELCEMRSERNDAVQMEAHYKSELARVRGLLQRLIVYSSYHATCLACDKTAVIDAGQNPVHEPDCWLVKELAQVPTSAKESAE